MRSEHNVVVQGFASQKHAREFAKWVEQEGIEASRGYFEGQGLKVQPVDQGSTYPLRIEDDNIVVELGAEEVPQPKQAVTTGKKAASGTAGAATGLGKYTPKAAGLKKALEDVVDELNETDEEE